MNSGKKSFFNSLRRILVMVVLIYIGSIMVISLREGSYLYYPTTFPETWFPPPDNIEYSDISFPISSGAVIHGWWFPGSDSGPVIMFFHGNAGHLAMRYSLIQFLMGCNPKPGGILIVDYPGYGKSTGEPSEKSLFKTADNVRQYLKGTLKIPSERLIVFGRSLGGAVALYSAVVEPCAGLVMECSFLSVPRLAEEYYPFLPGLKFFSRQRFDNETRIRKLNIPVLVIHGNRDSIIPIEQGRELYKLAPQPKTYLEIDKANHDNVYLIDTHSYRDAWNKFLTEVSIKNKILE